MAQKSGKNPDMILTEAIEKLAREAGIKRARQRQHKTPQEKARALDEISQRFVARPVLDERSSDEIIGYDKFGVPR